jgi:type IV secretory pathway VirJ component
LKEWGKSSLIIVGYSFGADVASFLPGRLSDELHNKIKKVILISPSVSNDFVIRLSDLIGVSEQVDRKYKVEPELNNTDLPVICIFGSEEQLILKTKLLKKKNISIFELPGDHRYNDNFALLFKVMGM